MGETLAGQLVVVIGGTAGIGLETAIQARDHGAEVVITGRDPQRLADAARRSHARGVATFDASDEEAVQHFFQELDGPVDHVVLTAGRPYYGPLLKTDTASLRQAVSERIVMSVSIARHVAGKLRPGGSLVLLGGTSVRRPSPEFGIATAVMSAMSSLTSTLALELAPARANLVAAGFVDTPLSAALLGDQLDARREQLRANLPTGKVVTAAEVAALVIHVMANSAITGATLDIDGGEQFMA